MKSGKTKRRIAALVLILLLAVGQAGCSMLKSGIHDLHGSIFGNEYNIDIFDNMGIRTLRTHGEKIDIVNYSDIPEDYIAAALSPSEVISVTMLDESKSCRVVVPDSQLSLAIGKEGQNARLAAKLTGFKIDIKPESES